MHDFYFKILRDAALMSRTVLLLILLCLSIGFVGRVSAETTPNSPSFSSIFLVNSNNNNDDDSCDATHCSLHEAIDAANADSDHSVILFDFPTDTTIAIDLQLPEIAHPVTIDGITGTGSHCPTAPDAPADLKITLDGQLAGTNTAGLVLQADDSSIVGLNIVRFSGHSIRLGSPSQPTANNSIRCNHIGLPNANLEGYENGDAIELEGVNHEIGGENESDRNVIVGNYGIRLASDHSRIRNNYIGTTLDGSQALASAVGMEGIIDSGSGNEIGDSNDGNVIGNYEKGIRLSAESENASILNNQIGVDRSGRLPIANLVGIEVDQSVGANIGEPITVANSNLIAFNTQAGLKLYSTTSITITNNLIQQNAGPGIDLVDANATTIQLNSIFENAADGIYLNKNSTRNRITKNAILNNGGLGIDLEDSLGNSGISANDADDADTGANNVQNAPGLSQAFDSGLLTGTFERATTHDQAYTIDVYTGAFCDTESLDGQAFGEGARWIDSFEIGAGSSEPTIDWFYVLETEVLDSVITLTATDFEDNTSEFSNCMQIEPYIEDYEVDDAAVFTDTNPGDGMCLTAVGTCTLPAAVQEANASGGAAITFNLPVSSTIALDSTLVLTSAITIDGASNIGASCPTADTPANLNVTITANSNLDGALVNLSSGSNGSEIRGLIIAGSQHDGIQIHSLGNKVACNIIGGDFSVDLGNAQVGVHIMGGGGNTIGATSNHADRNVIFGNGGAGIQIDSATSNTISGNYIGIDESGTNYPNQHGVRLLNNADSNLIGGANSFMPNVIDGNAVDGVRIISRSDFNIIINNQIGNIVGNGRSGIRIANAENNRIGTVPTRSQTGLTRGNIINNNADDGIYLTDSNETIIGANTLTNNNRSGIRVIRSDGVIVDNNSVSSSGASGIYLNDSIDNFIATGNQLIDNEDDGVHLDTTVQDSLLMDNTITGNQRNGIRVDSTATNNDFYRNAIFDNGGVGIDLGEDDATLNDDPLAFDSDLGANGLQNYPKISEADALSNTIKSLFISHPNTPFRIDYFVNSSCDSLSSHGEGENYAGSEIIMTDESGRAKSEITSSVTFNNDDEITTTATRLDGDGTSEFSLCFTVIGGPPVAIDLQNQSAIGRSGAVLTALAISFLALLLSTVSIMRRSAGKVTSHRN